MDAALARLTASSLEAISKIESPPRGLVLVVGCVGVLTSLADDVAATLQYLGVARHVDGVPVVWCPPAALDALLAANANGVAFVLARGWYVRFKKSHLL